MSFSGIPDIPVWFLNCYLQEHIMPGEGADNGEGTHPSASQYCTTGYGGGPVLPSKGNKAIQAYFSTWKMYSDVRNL